MKKALLMLAAAALIVPAGAFANTSLDVNAGAAIQGSFGLEVLWDGGTGNAYVQDDSPNGELIYHVTFSANRNTFDPGAADTSSFYVFTAREQVPSTANVIRFYVRRNPDNPAAFHARAIARNDDGSWKQVGCGNFGAVDQTYEVIWKAAPGVNNGELICLRNGVAPPSNTNLTLDNDTRQIDDIRFGYFQSAPLNADAIGSYHVDEFISTRTP